jgi:hypothetical protein
VMKAARRRAGWRSPAWRLRPVVGLGTSLTCQLTRVRRVRASGSKTKKKIINQ